MSKLVCMLRVKDGILFVNEWLKNMEKLVDEIVVVDNGSKDGTFEILSKHPKVVNIVRTEGFDEGRDKNLLYEMARERMPDWLLWLDIDELFELSLTRAKLNKLLTKTKANRIFFRRFHFIDEKHFNAKWYWIKYISSPDRVLWREQKTGYFENIVFNNGLIKGIAGRASISHYRIKHLGYVYKNEVKKKLEIYRKIDPTLKDTYNSIQFDDDNKMKWFEYFEAPVRVTLMNYFLDFIWLFKFLPYKLNERLNWHLKKMMASNS